jgi:hypothetical protein
MVIRLILYIMIAVDCFVLVDDAGIGKWLMLNTEFNQNYTKRGL